MEKPTITVESISKSYQLGLKAPKYLTFRDTFADAVRSPLRRLRHLSGKLQNGDDTFWALKDVSFEVKRGEVVGIIGRNGAGKSTLLKILSRITEPTRGRAVLRGRVASLLEVGTGFHPELTGRENTYLNGSILGMRKKEIDRKFDEIVAFAEIEKFLDTPVKHYSSGMYVRLAFSVAAHLEPEILVVDEVLAVGDAEFQKKCLGKMKEVATEDRRTVLFVSHNLAAIQQLCDRCICLDSGRIQCDDEPTEAVAAYLHSRRSENLHSKPLESEDFCLSSVAVTGEGNLLTSLRPARINVQVTKKRDFVAAAHVFVDDDSGTFLFGLNSSDFIEDTVSTRQLNFSFRLAGLPLNSGRYYLRIILRNDSDFRSWEVPNDFSIDVHPSNVYGVRQTSRRWFGPISVSAAVQIYNQSESQVSR
jgi:lipopolysaccharide transport system ATP-binding protein